MNKSYNSLINKLKFDKNGLIPAVIQDYKTNKVLMVAWMNKQSLINTLKTKKTWFYSRSRKKLWMKGEVSGNTQLVKEIYIDCDNDCLLIKVIQVGGASCHTGYTSCFYRKFTKNKFRITERQIFNPDKVYNTK